MCRAAPAWIARRGHFCSSCGDRREVTLCGSTELLPTGSPVREQLAAVAGRCYCCCCSWTVAVPVAGHASMAFHRHDSGLLLHPWQAQCAASDRRLRVSRWLCTRAHRPPARPGRTGGRGMRPKRLRADGRRIMNRRCAMSLALRGGPSAGGCSAPMLREYDMQAAKQGLHALGSPTAGKWQPYQDQSHKPKSLLLFSCVGRLTSGTTDRVCAHFRYSGASISRSKCSLPHKFLS